MRHMAGHEGRKKEPKMLFQKPQLRLGSSQVISSANLSSWTKYGSYGTPKPRPAVQQGRVLPSGGPQSSTKVVLEKPRPLPLSHLPNGSFEPLRSSPNVTSPGYGALPARGFGCPQPFLSSQEPARADGLRNSQHIPLPVTSTRQPAFPPPSDSLSLILTQKEKRGAPPAPRHR